MSLSDPSGDGHNRDNGGITDDELEHMIECASRFDAVATPTSVGVSPDELANMIEATATMVGGDETNRTQNFAQTVPSADAAPAHSSVEVVTPNAELRSGILHLRVNVPWVSDIGQLDLSCRGTVDLSRVTRIMIKSPMGSGKTTWGEREFGDGPLLVMAHRVSLVSTLALHYGAVAYNEHDGDSKAKRKAACTSERFATTIQSLHWCSRRGPDLGRDFGRDVMVVDEFTQGMRALAGSRIRPRHRNDERGCTRFARPAWRCSWTPTPPWATSNCWRTSRPSTRVRSSTSRTPGCQSGAWRPRRRTHCR